MWKTYRSKYICVKTNQTYVCDVKILFLSPYVDIMRYYYMIVYLPTGYELYKCIFEITLLNIYMSIWYNVYLCTLWNCEFFSCRNIVLLEMLNFTEIFVPRSIAKIYKMVFKCHSRQQGFEQKKTNISLQKDSFVK